MYIPAGITTSDIGSISGTGADNRIPTFTDATNIQGEANLTFDGTDLTIATGSIQVRTIDYSDGDLAMTIADGGGVTFAQNMTVPNIEVGDGGYIRFGGDYPMIDDNGYLQFINATDADFWWTHGSTNLMHLDSSASKLSILGATPMLSVGNGGDVDTGLLFIGHGADYHIGFNSADDYMYLGKGTTIGSLPGIVVGNQGNIGIGVILVTAIGSRNVRTHTVIADNSALYGQVKIIFWGKNLTDSKWA